MSSYDGGGFDEWLSDSFSGVPADKWAAIKAIMEPHRESIETSLEGFEPDEMSWRSFRNGLWYGREVESAKIQSILDGTLSPDEVLRPARPGEQEYGALVMGAPPARPRVAQ